MYPSPVFLLGIILMSLLIPTLSWGKSCYAHIDYGEPFNKTPKRALYIFIDQTTPLSGKMRQRVKDLVAGWGQQGDLIKIAQFSANFRNQYPTLLFSQQAELVADGAYLFQLRWSDKHKLLKCLNEQKTVFIQKFRRKLSEAMNGMNAEIPKTDLLYSLKQLAKYLLITDEALIQNVLIVSDGMENSAGLSFYKNKKIRAIKASKVMSNVRRRGLVANWKNANIYMYGLGLAADEKDYQNIKITNKLRSFWERYFSEGNGNIKILGSPDLLLTGID